MVTWSRGHVISLFRCHVVTLSARPPRILHRRFRDAPKACSGLMPEPRVRQCDCQAVALSVHRTKLGRPHIDQVNEAASSSLVRLPPRSIVRHNTTSSVRSRKRTQRTHVTTRSGIHSRIGFSIGLASQMRAHMLLWMAPAQTTCTSDVGQCSHVRKITASRCSEDTSPPCLS